MNQYRCVTDMKPKKEGTFNFNHAFLQFQSHMLIEECKTQNSCLLRSENAQYEEAPNFPCYLKSKFIYYLVSISERALSPDTCLYCTGVPLSRVHVPAHGWRLALLTGRQGQRGSSVSPFSVAANQIPTWSCDSQGDFIC